MKKLVEAFKKEEYTDYVLALFGVGFWVYLFFLALFEAYYKSLPTTLVVVTASISIAAWLLLFYKAIKHDRLLEEKNKDERELQHDYEVAHTGYTFLISLVGIYWLSFDQNIWLLSIIIVTLGARLLHRFILED